MVKDSRKTASVRRVRAVNEPALRRIDVDGAGLPANVESAAVASVLSRWRVDDEWWRPRPVSRLYFNLLLDDGRHLTVFHDLLSLEWYEQRYA